MAGLFRSLFVALTFAAILPAYAQTAQTPDTAIAQDAAAVAERLGLPPDQAARQLRLQEASVPVTDALSAEFADRLAGIAIDHRPAFRILVRLTGDAPEPDRSVIIAGTPVSIQFVPNATTTLTGMAQAITAHQAEIRASLIAPPGLGVDQRSGELVAVVAARDVEREGAQGLRDRLASLTRVPVRLRVLDQPALDMAGIAGGGRLVGSRPGDPARYVCTAGFAVTDGARYALATAAHCPDELAMRDVDGTQVVLPFLGQWGWGNQDVQVNLAPAPLAPVFYADTAKTVLRPVTTARGRATMRAGDVLCHRGERTGYSCSQVELTDFAPAGDLCGGACLPTWTTVAGPGCKGGDSGSPVFIGTTAVGILKGGSYRRDGSCGFYFFMSTDFLPTGWTLVTQQSVSLYN
ncbi:S1 family peptidase [Sphingomonas sp. Leaf33]|uniref:S1 family peptidase n=1 Tax=Sphingomonas sp. Leaf33 TaxID=1736215 RepID=UPI000B136822|nr:S1 family peptidase [Sphingomonas sp. Leaf33]